VGSPAAGRSGGATLFLIVTEPEKECVVMPVELDPVLLEVLACPAQDHGPLRLGTPDDTDADALTCTACGRVFPVRDGIPVLLLDETIGGPEGEPPADPAP
jgi:uncharacterized protein YbaR (Trm112 family)